MGLLSGGWSERGRQMEKSFYQPVQAHVEGHSHKEPP